MTAHAQTDVGDWSASGLSRQLPAGPVLPMLASACPGWVCYAEKTQGAWVLPHISSAKSPQAVQGYGACQPSPGPLVWFRKWRPVQEYSSAEVALRCSVMRKSAVPCTQVAGQAVAGAAAGQEAERRLPLRCDAVLRQEAGGVPRGLPAARYLLMYGAP